MKLADAFKYANYSHYIDLDAFEAAIGFEPIRQGNNKRGELEDIGHCLDPWNLHKHGDTTGKFAINREQQIYGCFVCGGGNLLSLTMAVMDMPEAEAESWLYQFATPVEKSDQDFLSEIDAILYQEKIDKPPLPWYNEHVLERWSDIQPIAGWLEDRGVSEDVASKARVGFQADALRMAAPKGGKPSERSHIGPCVYLPHFWGGRLVGWQQRWIDQPSWIPKYTNTSGFPRSETIYNYENVYLAQQPIIIVESVLTVLFLRTMGLPAVALFGGAPSEEQMRLLRHFHQGLVLAPDNDGPGRKWTSYSEEELEAIRKGRRVDRVILAEYLAHYVPLRVIEPVGEYDSGNDLGDLLDEGLKFAHAAVKLLYEEARYF